VVLLGRDQTEEWKGWMQVRSASVFGCFNILLNPTGSKHFYGSQLNFSGPSYFIITTEYIMCTTKFEYLSLHMFGW
jgi:hypothetical protein